MGKIFEQITQKEHLLASYRDMREKFFDVDTGQYAGNATGLDGMELKEFDRDLEAQILRCQKFLLNPDSDFVPQILTRVPKDTPGKFRDIYLLSLRDKVVHKAIADPLAMRLERHFYPNLQSFRKGKYYGTVNASRKVRKAFEEYQERAFVFKADISDYFDSIDQGMLLEMFKKLIPDEPELLQLLEKFVRQRRLAKGILYSPTLGVPTGSSLSPVCANLYLNELDRQMFRKGYNYIRYCDDLLLIARDRATMEAGRKLIEEILVKHLLTLSPKKSHVYEPGVSFDYLGYHFDGKKVGVGTDSLKKFRQWIRELLPRNRFWDFPNETPEDRKTLLGKILKDFNTGKISLETAGGLNLTQLPWIRSFPVVNDDRTLREMDLFIKNRIRLVITRNISGKNYKLVPDAWFRELGYKSLTGAYYRIIRRRSLAPYYGWRRYFGTNFQFLVDGAKKPTTLRKKWEGLKDKVRFVIKALNGELEL